MSRLWNQLQRSPWPIRLLPQSRPFCRYRRCPSRRRCRHRTCARTVAGGCAADRSPPTDEAAPEAPVRSPDPNTPEQ